MNLEQFLNHHGLTENPFAAEEARHDPVFRRLGGAHATHPDFAKIAGDPARPAAAVVFGERGAGKTAIRMQLEELLATHNIANPKSKAFLIVHDDLDPMIERFTLGFGIVGTGKEEPLDKALTKLRLADHCDWMLHLATTRLVDGLLNTRNAADGSDLAHEGIAALRRAPRATKDELLLLQSIYDRAETGGERTRRLAALIALPRAGADRWWSWLIPFGWMPSVALYVYYSAFTEHTLIATPGNVETLTNQGLAVAIAAGAWALLLLIYAIVLIRRLFASLALSRTIAGIRKRIRVTPRDPGMIRASLRRLPQRLRSPSRLPIEGDEWRRDSFASLRRILTALGYTSTIIIVDRVDEPTQVAGRIARMKSLAWPLLNNRFLQQEGMGFKLLLPIELRAEVFRESPEFFRSARLDKQNMIERLQWSGAMLYDLCNTRLRACTKAGRGAPSNQGTSPSGSSPTAAAPRSLTELFDDDVSRETIVDALDHMHHPRDAFKMLYRAMQEHCAAVTAEEGRWRISRLALDQAKRTQSDRVQLMREAATPA
ncbi:MAG: hypothetical protein ACTS3F_00240 [Phycisphaerales bacterium]